MAVNSKSSLIDYCLRDLGHPLIQIHVSDEQLEDRVEEALEYFREYHYDGIEKVYLKHALTQDNIDTKQIFLDDKLVYGVTKIIPYNQSSGGSNLFSLEYQIRLEDIQNLQGADLISYVTTQQHLSLLQNVLVGENPFRFNRITNIIHLDTDMKYRFAVGDYIIVECYRVMDPTEINEVWSNQWLKHYTTAVIKRQWATNIKFYGGMQLPGGIVIDGESLYSQAIQEIQDLRDELDSRGAPLLWSMG